MTGRDPHMAEPQTRPVRNVVGMQHMPTTFHGIANTPKKSADARLFCFTAVIARSRLTLRYEI
jgi:hypothetical protein